MKNKNNQDPLSFLKDIDFNNPRIKVLLDKMAKEYEEKKNQPIFGGVIDTCCCDCHRKYK